AVGGHGVVIAGLIIIGEGIQPLAAVLLDNFAKLVRDFILLRFLDRILPGFFQVFHLLLVTAHTLVTLGVVGCVGRLHFFESNFLGGIVLRPNPVGTLERHVFHHVRQAGFTQRI